ncbi:MAG: heparinase II/III-family protein, partial [Candidatus Omnitrophica bacterium]|nr:heparinase II/III-family protein [Candidatus Omnitrophota bacterium]
DFLLKMEGVSETGFFPIYITGPIDKTFNFADSSDRFLISSQLFYLAKKFKRQVFAWYAFKYKPFHPLDLIWFQSPVKPSKANMPCDRYFRNIEVVTMRSDWEKPDAIFVGFKAGKNSFSHSHLDIGSFVMDALGHRWIMDLGPDNYNLPGYFGKERWNYYRLRAEGHNTLVINPGNYPDQDPLASTKVTAFVSKDEYSFAIADITDAYKNHARMVKRGILLDRKNNAAIVQDEIKLKEKVNIWWFLHTQADVRTKHGNREIVLYQGNDELLCRIISPENATFSILEPEPLPGCPDPGGQSKNPGIKKIAININETAESVIKVALIPCANRTENPTIPDTKILDEWK